MLGAMAVQRVPWKNQVVAARDVASLSPGTGKTIGLSQWWMHFATALLSRSSLRSWQGGHLLEIQFTNQVLA